MRIISREFLNDMLDEHYKQQEIFVLSVVKAIALFVKELIFLKTN